MIWINAKSWLDGRLMKPINHASWLTLWHMQQRKIRHILLKTWWCQEPHCWNNLPFFLPQIKLYTFALTAWCWTWTNNCRQPNQQMPPDDQNVVTNASPVQQSAVANDHCAACKSEVVKSSISAGSLLRWWAAGKQWWAVVNYVVKLL